MHESMLIHIWVLISYSADSTHRTECVSAVMMFIYALLWCDATVAAAALLCMCRRDYDFIVWFFVVLLFSHFKQPLTHFAYQCYFLNRLVEKKNILRMDFMFTISKQITHNFVSYFIAFLHMCYLVQLQTKYQSFIWILYIHQVCQNWSQNLMIFVNKFNTMNALSHRS